MEAAVYDGLEPTVLWKHFAALTAIPRASGYESVARDYVREVVETAGASWSVDAAGNAIARVPATAGGSGPVVAIQAHLDMVCESEPGISHDFLRDPIRVRRENDNILATGTTLGADNGIGVAMALTLLSNSEAEHGPLELIFTVEEEIGLKGAARLDVSGLEAEMLINLDSEDDRSLTVGCAGGATLLLAGTLPQGPPPPRSESVLVRVSGLRGGHSGMEIHERHGNAIKLLLEVLEAARGEGITLALESIEGGSAHNAIPREAAARIAIADGSAAIASLAETVQHAWAAVEPSLRVACEDAGAANREALTTEATATVLTVLGELPHGVIEMSARHANTVATSANLAVARLERGRLEVTTSVRSLTGSGLAAVEDRIRAIETGGGEWRTESVYPSWEPRPHSALLELAVAAYEATYGRVPKLEVLHAGIECGVIVDRDPALDAISIGPLIEAAHSPGERVVAPTVADAYELLLALLAAIGATDA